MARAVTYDYYTDEYHGTAVAEEDWAHLALVASARLDRIKALATVTPYGDDESEAESMAICAMAETLQAWEDAGGAAGGGSVASEHIGSVSVTYGSAAQMFPHGLDAGLIDAVRPWLHVCLVVC